MTKEEEQIINERAADIRRAEPIEAKIESPSEVVLNANKVRTEQPKVEASTPKENAIDRLLNERIKQSEAEGKQIASQDPDSPEQVKRRKRNALIASIADGLSSIATMYSVSKGAPAPSAVAPTLSEVQKAQNVKDRNTYLELLQSWRKRNNELVNNYATYQAAAEKNRIANDNLRLSIDREARLYAKDVGERVYKEALLKYKQDQLDDLSAHRKAQIEQRKAELEARKEYWNRSLNIAQRRANNAAAGSTTETDYTYNQGKLVGKTVRKINNGNKQ